MIKASTGPRRARTRLAGRGWVFQRRLARASLVAALLLCVTGFSGEDVLEGNPWHHEDISRRALLIAGFQPDAADGIAWHADYIDSYLYNPIWWLAPWEGGSIDRFKVSLASYDELARLHFDDLFHASRVRNAWHRYLSGALAGLLWAADRSDFSAAHNILGVSLHAVQDFYSHSNWMTDPARWNRTWFEMEAERSRLNLWTGSYELPEAAGIQHHGKIAPECTVLRVFSPEVADVGCAAISPLSNTSTCHQWKACREGRTVGAEVTGLEIPGDVIYLAPAGINLDNTWQAAVGGRARGLLDDAGRWSPAARGELPSPEECREVVWPDSVRAGRDCTRPAHFLFAAAKRLAIRASGQWLAILDNAMRRAGAGDFWTELKLADARGTKEREFESYDRFPYQFLSAGPYPEAGSAEELFLRVTLETADEATAGTDADIYLHAAGQTFLLDYLPRMLFLLAYNDFETGDRQAYTVGPFDRLPAEIILANDAADAGDVLLALGRDFAAVFRDLAGALEDMLLSLVSGHADLVDSHHHVWQPEDLARIGTAPEGFSFPLDGRAEGNFQVEGTIRRTGEGSDATLGEWVEYEVSVSRLHCIEESDWDRGSDSDEPFLITSLVPLPGAPENISFGPYTGVDDGDVRWLNHSYARVRIPRNTGMLGFAATLFESDDEGSGGRRDLAREHSVQLESSTRREREGFLTALGRSLASDWKLERIQAVAFTRGGRVRVGTVLEQRVDAWIEGGSRRSFRLDPSRLRTYDVTAEDLTTLEGVIVAGGPIVAPFGPEVQRPRVEIREERELPPDAQLPPGANLPPGVAPPGEPPPGDVEKPGAAEKVRADRSVPARRLPPIDIGKMPLQPPGAATTDCLPYDPAALEIRDRGASGWGLGAEARTMALLDDRADAEVALAAARRHTRSCFVGRDNQRPDRARYIFHWFEGDSGLKTSPAGEDCLAYRKETLEVRGAGQYGWLVTDGRSSIQLLETRAEAERVLDVLERHSAVCYVGRDNRRSDRDRYILQYLRP